MRTKLEVKSILTEAKAEIEDVLHSMGVTIEYHNGAVFVQYEQHYKDGKSQVRGLPIINTPF